MKLEAKAIAQYFRASVSPRCSGGAIYTFASITAHEDEAFALLDRDAFTALLHDFIEDNGLVDIFLDMHDAGFGIEFFAEKRGRENPRQAVSKFASIPKYRYHATDTAAIYTVVNTWLIFFGAPAITTEWKTCPFCGGKIANGKCAQCKHTSKDAMAAIGVLSAMLEKERAGQAVDEPAFWDDITGDSEFDKHYKEEITSLRLTRLQEKDAELRRKKAEVMKAGKEAIAVFSSQLELEAEKENPDFDSLLAAIAASPAITAAAAYKDSAFSRVLNALKKNLAEKQKVHLERKEAVTRRIAFESAVEVFSAGKDFLDSKLAGRDALAGKFESGDLKRIKEKLKETESAYNCLRMGIRQDEATLSEKFQTQYESFPKTRERANKCIAAAETESKLNKQLQELSGQVKGIMAEVRAARVNENRASRLRTRIRDLIESNEAYQDLRKKKPQEYEQLLTPLYGAVADLEIQETQDKWVSFSAEAKKLQGRIRKARPAEGLSTELGEAFVALKGNPYYTSILTHKDVASTLAELATGIAALKEKEKQYALDMEKKKKRHKRNTRIAATLVVLLLVLVVGAIFALDLGGYVPQLVFDAVTPYLHGKVEGGNLTVTGADGEHVEIGPQARIRWQFSSATVTSVADGAFRSASRLKTVSLPQTIVSIGEESFYECVNLSSLKLAATVPPTLGEDAFAQCASLSIYVPVDAYGDYLKNESWGEYSELIFPDYGIGEEEVTILFDYGEGEVDSALSLGDGLYGVQALSKGTSLASYKSARYGYVFGGWATASGTPVATATRSSKLYAVWSEATAELSFDLCGGEGELAPQPVSYGSPVGTLPTPHRAGYTFTGWYDEDGARYTENTAYMRTDSITLYAEWSANEYTVTLDYQGGVEGATEFSVVYGTAIGNGLPMSATKAGNTFKGWFSEIGGGGKEYTNESLLDVAGGLTLYAKWELPITLNYDSGDADVSMDAVYRAPLSGLPETAEREGFTFAGWYTELGGGGSKYQNGTVLDADAALTLYAKWTATLTFDAKGGTPAQTVQDVVYRAPIGELPEVSLTRATFGGWYFGEPFSSEPLTEETVYLEEGPAEAYAGWYIEVTFDYQGGKEGTVTERYPYGNADPLNLPTPEEADFRTFGGWYTQAGGGGKLIEGPITLDLNTPETLYAKWDLTVTLDYDDGAGTLDREVEAVYKAKITSLPETLTVEGRSLTFAGWYTQVGGGGKEYRNGDILDTNSALILHAKWTATITFLAPQGTPASTTQTAVYHAPYGVLPEPEREDVAFAGWYKSSALESNTRVNTGDLFLEEGDVTLYAKWAFSLSFAYEGADGGERTPSIIVEDGQTISKLPLPTRTGHTFCGWWSALEGGEEYQVGHPFRGTQNTVAYARWEVERYSITAKGADIGKQELSVTYGEAWPNLNSEKVGHAFLGWFYGTGDARRAIDLKEPVPDLGDLADGYREGEIAVPLEGEWVIEYYVITLLAEGSDVPERTLTYQYGDYLNTFMPPYLEGHRLAAWMTQEEGGEEFVFGDLLPVPDLGDGEIVEDKSHAEVPFTLYARWELEQYELRFKPDSDITAEETVTITYGDELALPDKPVKTGYTFKEWTCTVRGNQVHTLVDGEEGIDYGDDRYNVPVVVEVNAQWVVETYVFTLVYWDYAASRLVERKNAYKASYGYTMDLTPHDPKSEGYQFLGWCLESYGAPQYLGKGNTVSPGTVPDFGDPLPTESIETNCVYVTLYGNWFAVQYSLTIKTSDKGGSVDGVREGTYTFRTHLSFTVIYSGSKNKRLTVDGQNLGSITSYDFYMPSHNVEIEVHSESSCIAAGSMILLADGTERAVEELHVGDKVLAWDFISQSFVETEIIILTDHGVSACSVLNLTFDNGNVLRTIGDHVLFDMEERAYVTIDVNNYASYIGDRFLCYNSASGAYETCVLQSGTVTEETTGVYSIVTAYYYNYVAEGVVNTSPAVPGFYEWIASYLSDDFTFDTERLEADLALYGTYDYDAFSVLMSPEQFEKLCGPYYKVVVELGFTTWDILWMVMSMNSSAYQ